MQYFDFRLCIKHKQNHVLAKRETISICESKTSKDSLTNFSWCNDFPCTYLQCRHYPFQLDPSHKVLIALWQALHQKTIDVCLDVVNIVSIKMSNLYSCFCKISAKQVWSCAKNCLLRECFVTKQNQPQRRLEFGG